MPWFPDFVSAVELARRASRAQGQDDPVGRYFSALDEGDPDMLEAIWPGEVVVYDPRAGEVRGHRQLHRFVRQNMKWLGERRVRIETAASTSVTGRAVVEVLAHLTVDGRDLSWPVAVVAESDDDLSVVFRTYCSQWPVDGERHVRPPILPPGTAWVPDIVARYEAALRSGDVDAVLGTFAPDGCFREPIGPDALHCGATALRSFFAARLGSGGTELQQCVTTDDGARCAVEYTCDRFGGRDVPPQAGLCVYERDADGLLASVRVYDDIDVLVG